MRSVDVWRNVPDAEFDHAMEGMEKIVMNRLYELFVSFCMNSQFMLTYSYVIRPNKAPSHPKSYLPVPRGL